MDLMVDFLQTQEISFSAIIKHLKNLPPSQVKIAINQHHARMLAIATSQYSLTPTSKNTPGSTKKRAHQDSSSDNSSKGPLRTSIGGSASDFAATKRRVPPSASTPTPRKRSKAKKTPTLDKSGGAREPDMYGGIRDRMQPTGENNLFHGSAFTTSPSGLKTLILISDTETEESSYKEDTSSNDLEGRDVWDHRKEFDDAYDEPEAPKIGRKSPWASKRGGESASAGPASKRKDQEKGAGDGKPNKKKVEGARGASKPGEISATQRGESSRAASGRLYQATVESEDEEKKD